MATATTENTTDAQQEQQQQQHDPKLIHLRELMALNNIDAFIIPSEDPHMSEYPPECDARRAFISGFDGSAGTAVVTTAAAALWTDGRYFLQAEQQLGPEWTLMKAGTPKVPEIHEWLIATVREEGRVGIDPSLHTIEAAEKLQKQLAATGRELVPLVDIKTTASSTGAEGQQQEQEGGDVAMHTTNGGANTNSTYTNLVDVVWGGQRPPPPSAPLRPHPLQWAGLSVEDKLAAVRKEMEGVGAGALAVTMLDEVAWLLNVRGGDVAYNPVALAYVLVTTDKAIMFVDVGKVTEEVGGQLGGAGVEVRGYEEAFEVVGALAAEGVKIWMDPTKVSFAMKTAAVSAAAASASAGVTRKRAREGQSAATGIVGASGTGTGVVIEKASPVTAAKAVKNEAELAGMREAHIRDGVALVKFFAWLDKTIAQGTVLTECQIDEELTARRAAQPGFVEPSFPTIAGANSNGAIIHYRPLPHSCASVDQNTLLLLDSGGQYDCGTTDITRTMHMGEPTPYQKAAYTAVLKGHIGLDTAVFPEGTPGCAIDTLARTALWRLGLNYRHGTGHGVGAALNVHEGPQSISARFWNTQPLLPNMVCSNEPGFYEDGGFGIRIENLFVVVPAETAHKFAGEYYTCRRLTVCPLQKKMIDVEALSEEERSWVDGYHREVWEVVGGRLGGEGGTAEEMAWLKQATAPL